MATFRTLPENGTKDPALQEGLYLELEGPDGAAEVPYTNQATSNQAERRRKEGDREGWSVVTGFKANHCTARANFYKGLQDLWNK